MRADRDSWAEALRALDKQEAAAFAKLDKSYGRLIVGLCIIAAGMVMIIIGIILGVVLK